MNAKQLNRFALVALLVTVLALMTPSLGLAAGPLGSGPDNALAPTGAMVHIQPGQQQWYVFHSNGQNQDNDPSRIRVVLTSMPQGSTTFMIWTPERLAGVNTQDPNKPVQPVGMGTRSTFTQDGETVDRNPGMLFWADDAKVGGTFYVVVQSTSGQASDYILNVSGDSISFPTTLVQSQPQIGPRTLPVTGNAAAPKAAPQAAPAAKQLGSSPALALPIMGRPMVLNAGQMQWYAVQVPGDSNRDDKSRVQIRLTANPGGAAKFTVWTRERMNEVATADPDQKIGPVGIGTPLVSRKDSDGNRFDLYGGDLFWLGDGRVGGTYYIVVEPTGSTPVNYTLTLTEMHQ